MGCKGAVQEQTQGSQSQCLPVTLSSSELVTASATADVRLGLDGSGRLDFKECEAWPGWERIELFPSSLERDSRDVALFFFSVFLGGVVRCCHGGQSTIVRWRLV